MNGNAGQLDGISIVAGHEYAETLTDQNPAGGWIVNSAHSAYNGEEIGDLCAWIGTGGVGGAQNVAMLTGTFAMQGLWSNADTGCRISDPTIANGTGVNTITVTPPPAQTVPVNTASPNLQIAATDSGGAAMTFAVAAGGLPTGLNLSSSGLISGTPTAPGSFNATVKVSDSTGASASTTVAYTVTNLITITPVPTQTAHVGVAITPVQINATDSGAATMTFLISSGVLPAGVTMNATGYITGTPSASTNTSATIAVSDASGAVSTTTVKFSFTNVITVQPVAVIVARGAKVSVQVVATDSGGLMKLSYSVSGLPRGFSISSTGFLTGTAPTRTGTYTGTVKVSDSTGASGSATVSITT